MRKFTFPPILVFIPVIAFASGNANKGFRVVPEIPDTLNKLEAVEVVSQPIKRSIASSTPLYEIDHQAMKERGVTDIADAMRRIPGVNIRDYGGAGGMKTISLRGIGSQHTGVVYDGAVLNNSQTGQIDLSRYSLENMSKITVYSGDNDDIFISARAAASASSLYLCSWHQPVAVGVRPSLNFHFKTGSFGLLNPYVRFSKKLSKMIDFNFNVNYVHSKNDYPFIVENSGYKSKERRSNSRMNMLNSELNMRINLAGGGFLNAKLYYYYDDRQLPGAVKYYVNTSHENLKDRNFFGQLNLIKDLPSCFSISAAGRFNWESTHYTDRNGKYTNGLRNDHYIQKESYLTASLLWHPSSCFSFDYSADVSYSTLKQFILNASNPVRTSILQTVAGKLATSRITVTGRILLSNHFNSSTSAQHENDVSKLSPMLSLSVRPFESSQFFIRASYKNIFRLPTFNEAYFDNYGSLNLKPENTDQFNLGLTLRIDGGCILDYVNITTDSYVNHVRNKIVAVPYNMFLWTMSNIGKVRTLGTDAGISAEFDLGKGNRGIIASTYSLQNCRNRTMRGSVDWMKQIAYVPEHSGSASVTWINPWVNYSLSMTSMGKRFTNNTNIKETEINGFTEFACSFFRDFNCGKVKIGVRGELLNLLNARYEIIARYPMPGRSWKMTLTAEL